MFQSINHHQSIYCQGHPFSLSSLTQYKKNTLREVVKNIEKGDGGRPFSLRISLGYGGGVYFFERKLDQVNWNKGKGGADQLRGGF